MGKNLRQFAKKPIKAKMLAVPATTSDTTGQTKFINKLDVNINIYLYEDYAADPSTLPVAIVESNNYLVKEFEPDTWLAFADINSLYEFDSYRTVAVAGQDPVKYYFEPLQQPLDDVLTGPGDFKTVPNFESFLHGYNFNTIDPLIIDSSDGMKGLVYEPLKSSSIDYHAAGDYLVKNSFNFTSLGLGWGSTATAYLAVSENASQYDTEHLPNSVHAALQGINLVYGISIFGGTFSNSYEAMTGSFNGSKSTYTISKKNVLTYSLGIQRDSAKFDSDFENAAQNDLPYDETLGNISTWDQVPPEMQEKYLAFIEKYGTHVPNGMNYGGYYVLMSGMSETDLKKSAQLGINIEASAGLQTDGLSVSGSTAGGATSLGNAGLDFATSTEIYQYRGGAGGSDGNWGLEDFDDSQVMSVQLTKLSDLFDVSTLLNNIMSSEVLSFKRTILSLAIDESVQTKTPNPDPMPPLTYRLRWTDFKLDGATNATKQLIGTFKVKQSTKLMEFSNDDRETITFFHSDSSDPFEWLNSYHFYPDREDYNPDAKYSGNWVLNAVVRYEDISSDLYLDLLYALQEYDPDSAAEDYNFPNDNVVRVKIGGFSGDDIPWVAASSFDDQARADKGVATKEKDGYINCHYTTSWVTE